MWFWALMVQEIRTYLWLRGALSPRWTPSWIESARCKESAAAAASCPRCGCPWWPTRPQAPWRPLTSLSTSQSCLRSSRTCAPSTPTSSLRTRWSSTRTSSGRPRQTVWRWGRLPRFCFLCHLWVLLGRGKPWCLEAPSPNCSPIDALHVWWGWWCLYVRVLYYQLGWNGISSSSFTKALKKILEIRYGSEERLL